MQIAHDVSVAGYLNYIRTWTHAQRRPATSSTTTPPRSRWPATPAALVDRMNLLLFSGTMPRRAEDADRRGGRQPRDPGPAYPPGTPASAIPTTTPTNQAAIDAAKLDRVYLAVFLSMASPDYLIQK